MSNFKKDLIKILITSLLSFVIAWFIFYKQNGLDFIDVEAELLSDYISTKNYRSEDLKITVSDKEKKELSQLRVILLNYSKSAYEDKIIKFMIAPKTEKKFEYLSHYAFGEGGLQLESEIKKIHLDDKTEDANSVLGYSKVDDIHIFSYYLKNFNQDSSIEDFGMQIKILFEGNIKTLDDFNIKVLIEGLNTRKYDSANRRGYYFEQVKLNLKLFGILVIVLFVFAIIAYMFNRIISSVLPNNQIVERKRFATNLYKASLYEDIEKVFDNETLKNDIQKFAYLYRYDVWKKKNKYLRVLVGFSKPELKHFYID